jgi:23S rRNA (guanosine2251-2'-O)-methyltransferase
MSERIIYGINTVQQALNKRSGMVLKVFLQREIGQQRLQRLSEELRSQSLIVERLSADELTQLTGSAKHQGVAAAISGLRAMDDGAALDYLAQIDDPLILVLDGVEDPRNYGACLRTADGAGVDLVVSGRSRGVDLTPVVSKVASGAAEVQPLARVANLARFLKSIKDLHFNIVGLDEAGDSMLYESHLTGPLALVMGAEGNGLRRLTKERCDALVRLPMLGSVESLNVSVAAGVCLYEALRQRSHPGSHS